MRRNVKIPLLIVAGLLAAIMLVGGGFLLGVRDDVGSAVRSLFPSVAGPSSSSADSYQLQQEVLDRLKSTYYKPVDEATLHADAIDGMVAGLDDPYTEYWDPEQYASFKQGTSGAYTGVGMEIMMENDLPTIVSTFKGSPAADAGILPGDIITTVNGQSVDGMTLKDVVSHVKGDEGTTVAIELYRPPESATTTTSLDASGGAVDSTTSTTENVRADISNLPPGGETKSYELMRKLIEVPVTSTEIVQAGDKKVAHITLSNFYVGSAAALRTAVKRAVEVDEVDAIVLDLRDNGGGFLDQGVGVASVFIPQGKEVVSTEGLHEPKKVFTATGDAYADIPLYVLTNGHTASASEIVAGALQDYKRATLVGETTFGKGVVQSISALSNGGALKATTAVYHTPNGRDINKIGITPDVTAPDDPKTKTVDETLQEVLRLIAERLQGSSSTSTSSTTSTTAVPSTTP